MKDEKSCGTNSAAQVEGKKPYSENNKTAEQHANVATAKAVQPFKRSKLVTAVAVVVSIVVALCAFLMVWYLGDDYPDFKRFRQSFAIPGLEEGLIPQGVANYNDTFYVSGYMNDGSPARIYVIEDGVATGYVTVKLSDGRDYTGHASGIATNGSKFWMVSDSTVYVLSRTDIMSAAKNGGSVKVNSSWNANCSASFCYYTNNSLYVGEFYRSGKYETDETHHFTTPAGDENKALILRYSATSSNPYPTRAYSIPGNIQGMAFNSDSSKLILSQSYALPNSKILVYDEDSAKSKTGILKVGEYNVTVYYIDSSILEQTYSIPCMSEGLCSDGNRVYVLFESASAKYKPFVREQLKNTYYFTVRG